MPTLQFQPVRTLLVTRAVDMLTTIDFDRQKTFRARKIEDVTAGRVLAAKFEPVNLPVAQYGPEPFLGISRLFA